MAETFLIYNTILVLSVACAIGVKACSGWREWLMRGLLFVVMTVPAVLRYQIGTDYASYESIYNSSNLLFADIEPGYAGLNYIFYHLNAPVEWLFALMAVLTYAPIAFGVRQKYIVPVVLFYILTAYLPSYSIIRQSLVVSWLMVALLRYLDDEHIGRLYLTIVAASFIHLSALVVLPFVLFRRIHLSEWVVLLLLPVAFYVARHGFIDRLFNSELFLQSKYEVYVDSAFNRQTQLGSGLGIMLKMLVPVLYIIFSHRLEKHYDVVVYLSAGFLVALMLSVQVYIFNRLTDIMSFSVIVAFAVMYDKLRKPVCMIIITLLMVLNFQQTIRVNKSSNGFGLGITPYVTIFEK